MPDWIGDSQTLHISGGKGGRGGEGREHATGGEGGTGQGPTLKYEIKTKHLTMNNHFPNSLEGPDFESATFPIIGNERINLVRQLVHRPGYRIHLGECNGRAVVVKVFSGERARKNRDVSASLAHRFMHPNFLRIFAWSADSCPNPFLVYHGGAYDCAEYVVASVLREGVIPCMTVGVTVAHGIAMALSYLESNSYPLDNAIAEDFDLLVGRNNTPMISIRPDVSTRDSQREERFIYNPQVCLLDDLCQRVFTQANRLLYRDEIEGGTVSIFYPGDIPSVLSSLVELNSQSDMNKSLGIAGTGRRELVWETSDKDSDLSRISQEMEDYLFVLRLPSTGGFVQHYRPTTREQNHHICPGYRREEILLTTKLATSVVVSHSTPRAREICTICGQLVQDAPPSRHYVVSVPSFDESEDISHNNLDTGWEDEHVNEIEDISHNVDAGSEDEDVDEFMDISYVVDTGLWDVDIGSGDKHVVPITVGIQQAFPTKFPLRYPPHPQDWGMIMSLLCLLGLGKTALPPPRQAYSTYLVGLEDGHVGAKKLLAEFPPAATRTRCVEFSAHGELSVWETRALHQHIHMIADHFRLYLSKTQKEWLYSDPFPSNGNITVFQCPLIRCQFTCKSRQHLLVHIKSHAQCQGHYRLFAHRRPIFQIMMDFLAWAKWFHALGILYVVSCLIYC